MKRFNIIIATLTLAIMLATASYSYAGAPVTIVDATGTATTNVVSVTGNKLNSLTTPEVDEISRGNVTGKEDFNKFGANNDVGTSIEDVWLAGGTKTYLSAAEQLKILSSSADDDGDPVGTGARTVTIFALNDAGARISETVTMNGVTAVTTSLSMRDVYRMKVITSGTDLTNKGTITIKNNAETATLATIGAGFGQTLMTHFTVPTGYRELIKNLVLTATGGKDVTAYLFLRPPGESWQVKLSATLNNGVFTREYNPPLAVPAGTDIVIRAISVQAGGIADAGWDSILETE
jgi:hypothetical protein